MQTQRKLIEILDQKLAKEVMLSLEDLKNKLQKEEISLKKVSFTIKSIEGETYALVTKEGVDLLTFTASKGHTATPNAFSALRDMTMKMGKHISKRQLEIVVKIKI